MAMAESASLTVRRMEKGSYEFLVKNFSLFKGIGPNQPIESDQFMVGGHRWVILLYPDGMYEEDFRDGDVSLCISLESYLSRAVRTLFEFYLIDQSGRGNNWSHSLIQKRPKITPYLHGKGYMAGLRKFIKRSSLEPPSDYIKDDCLIITCTVGVLTSDIQDLPIADIPKPNIGADFGKLLESKHGADLFFRVEDETFGAHRCILAIRCPALLSSFSNAHKKQESVIIKMEARVFKAMLWFIYTGTLVEEVQDAFGDFHAFILNSFMVKMLAAADEFQLESLKKICVSRILESLPAESVAYLPYLADLYHAPELESACPSFSAEYQSGVKDPNGSESVEKSFPLLYQEIACFGESSEAQQSTSREMKLGPCTKVFSLGKGLIPPLDTGLKKIMEL